MDTLRNKTQGFTIVENKILKDKRMNMRDRGLYATLCSLPDGWELSVRGLAAILPEGKASITSSLNSLESAGYLIRHSRKVRGRITGAEWEIAVPESLEEEEMKESGTAVLINRTQGITIVKNNIIRNKNLALKERGLLVTLLGLPTGWRMSIQGLADILPDGRYAVGQSLKKIEEQGYLKRRQLREADGTWTGSIWEVFDEPGNPDDPEKAVKEKESLQKKQEPAERRQNRRMSGIEPDRVIQCADKPDREILQTGKPDREKEEPDDSS